MAKDSSFELSVPIQHGTVCVLLMRHQQTHTRTCALTHCVSIRNYYGTQCACYRD